MQSQLRLNAFFGKSTIAHAQDSPPKALSTYAEDQKRRCNSVPEEPDQTYQNSVPSSPIPKLKMRSVIQRAFLPFELPPHTECAPHNWVADNPQSLALKRMRLESLSHDECNNTDMTSLLSELKAHTSYDRVVSLVAPSVRSLMDDLDSERKTPDGSDPITVLRSLPRKYLHFHEDVRPPYCGTVTRSLRSNETSKLRRNPIERALDNLNYDYDSEAEWEEPEEGEDLMSEDEEELESEDGDEMEDFLDDEEDSQTKRKQLSNDLEPINSGLCWENKKGVIISASDSMTGEEFKEYGIGFLLGKYHVLSVSKFCTR
jgi:chromatin assembly factor 1 subunit A